MRRSTGNRPNHGPDHPKTPMPRPSQSSRPRSLSRYKVPVLDRAFDLLEVLAGRPEGMTLTDLTDALGIPKNTVFRIITTLSLRGYADRDEATKRYRLSRKMLSVSHAAVGGKSLIEAARPCLRSLRDASGETALLGAIASSRGVVLDQVPSSQPVKVVVEVGHAFPLHTAAPAKAMLAFLADDVRNALVATIRFTRRTPRTITSARAFARELAAVRSQGYALDRREESEAYACAAAPVFDHSGQVVAAIWVSGPSDRVTQARLPAMARLVTAAAQTVSATLGHETAEPRGNRPPRLK